MSAGAGSGAGAPSVLPSSAGSVATSASGSSSVNVRVVVRVRPLSSTEADMGVGSCVELDREAVNVRPPGGVGEGKNFRFDSAFGDDASQETVYK